MRQATFLKLLVSFFVCVFYVSPGFAQSGKSLVRAVVKNARSGSKISGFVKEGEQIFNAAVIDKSKLQYPSGDLAKMLEQDRTHVDKIISRESTMSFDKLEKAASEKHFSVMPSPIRASDPQLLMGAMLTSQETAQRVANSQFSQDFKIMSQNAAIRTYYARMEEFANVKKYVDTKMFYYHADNKSLSEILRHERWELVKQLSDMKTRLKFLALYYFPEDMPLYLANKYLISRLIEIEPGLGGVLEKLPSFLRKDRVFMQSEFLLHTPQGPVALPELPAVMKIAVVNDSEEIRRGISNFGRWGNFGQDAQVEAFESIYDLLEQVKSGVKYDVIFSDISMPKGSGMLFVSKLRENGNNTPVIGLSGYKEELIKARDFYEIGFDGYIVSADYGYRRAPEALRTYFYYKKLNNWMR